MKTQHDIKGSYITPDGKAMSYAIHTNEDEVTKALACARGCYQRSIIIGEEALSGATLKGKAKLYGSKYANSRHKLLKRMEHAGVKFHEAIGDHNKRLLVIGQTLSEALEASA